MVKNKVIFQHAATGFWIEAEYKNKWLTLKMLDSLNDWKESLRKSSGNEKEKAEMLNEYKETAQWCKDRSMKRFKKIEMAERYLKDLGHDVKFESKVKVSSYGFVK